MHRSAFADIPPTHSSRYRPLAALVVLMALVAGLVGAQVARPPVAQASHFRSSQLSWHATSTPRRAEFHFSQGLRRSIFGNIAVGGTVSVGPILFGDNTQTNAPATVVVVDATNDWILVEAHVAHTYATDGPYTAYFQSCCRLSAPQHRNNPDRQSRSVTLVNFAATTASPVSGIAPIVDCPKNGLCEFFVPATDADNQPLRFRLATATEAAGVNQAFVQPPGSSVDPQSGKYSWNTSGQSLNPSGNSYFSSQVIVENVVGQTVVSSTAVDFFLRLTDQALNAAPQFASPTPADGSVITTVAGQTVTFAVAASDQNGGDTVTLGMLNRPAGATFSTTPANPATANFSWTPSAVGSAVLTLIAQDQFGVGAIPRSVTIQVGDNLPPVVSVPGNLTVEATGPAGATAAFTATAVDNVNGALTPTCSPASGATFALATTTVTCSAADAAGNVGSASFTVTVTDTTGPAINGLGGLTVEAADASGAAVSFAPTATDLVDGSRPVTCSPASGTTFALGTTAVTCTSADTRTNTTTRAFSVKVSDTTKPVLTLPADMTLEATGPAGALATYTANATDSVSGPLAPTCSPASGSLFSLATTAVSCSATDGAGNSSSGSFAVTVVDTTAPSLSLPGTVTVEATGPAGASVAFSTSATDLVDSTVTVGCSAASGATFGVGDTTVTCTATDAAGNPVSGSFTVSVTDTTAPTVSLGAADITQEATGPSGAAVVFTASAHDLVDGAVAPACDYDSGDEFPLGDTVVTCTATDIHANRGAASFTVHVVDTLPPVLSTQLGIEVEASGADGATATFSVTAEDIVDGAVPVTCTPPSGSTFALGETLVVCSATDAARNPSAPRSFTVTVADTTAPAITVPATITAEATGSTGAAVSYADVPTMDLVDGPGTASCLPAAGSTFALGDTSVTCSATDGAGNGASASFGVTVVDTTPPAVVVPADVSVEATGPNGAAATYSGQSAEDLVDGAVAVRCAPASGSTFAVGDSTVVCTAADAAGNEGSKSFTVSVLDETAPDVTVPDDITAEATGPDGAAVSYPAASATDLVDGPLPTNCEPPPGSTFALGMSTVACSATDAHSNTGSASLAVTVIDTKPPAVTPPADVVAEATGPAGADVAFGAASASDLVDGTVAATCGPVSGTTFAIASTTVTCSADDARGNTGTATFTVTVRDTTAPELTVPADITAEATSPDGAAVSFVVSAVDLVDGAVAPACTKGSGATFPLGSTTVTCTATDAHDNASSESFTVTVQDTIDPVVTWSGNLGSYSVDQLISITCAATDSGSGVESSTCHSVSGPAASFSLGVHTYRATATDKSGNVGEATVTFTVVVTPDSLCALTRQYLTKSALGDPLCVKIRNGQAAAARGNKSGANTELVNYQNQVAAQAGKALTTEQAETLTRLAQALASSW